MKEKSTDIAGVRAAAQDGSASDTESDDTEVETKDEPEPDLVHVGAMQVPKQHMRTVIEGVADAMLKSQDKTDTGPTGINMERAADPCNDYDQQASALYGTF